MNPAAGAIPHAIGQAAAAAAAAGANVGNKPAPAVAAARAEAAAAAGPSQSPPPRQAKRHIDATAAAAAAAAAAQPPFKAAKHGRAPAAAAPAPAPAPAAAASKAASQGRAGKGGFSRQAAAAAAPAPARSAAAGGRPTAKATAAAAAAAAAGLGSGAQLNSLSECLGQALVARNAQGTSMGPASVAAKTRAALLAVMGVPQPPPGMPGMPIAVLAAHGPGDGGVVGHVASGPLAAAEMELPPPPAAAAAQERGAAGPTATDRGPEAAAAAATGAAGVGQSGAAGAPAEADDYENVWKPPLLDQDSWNAREEEDEALAEPERVALIAAARVAALEAEDVAVGAAHDFITDWVKHQCAGCIGDRDEQEWRMGSLAALLRWADKGDYVIQPFWLWAGAQKLVIDLRGCESFDAMLGLLLHPLNPGVAPGLTLGELVFGAPIYGRTAQRWADLGTLRRVFHLLDLLLDTRKLCRQVVYLHSKKEEQLASLQQHGLQQQQQDGVENLQQQQQEGQAEDKQQQLREQQQEQEGQQVEQEEQQQQEGEEEQQEERQEQQQGQEGNGDVQQELQRLEKSSKDLRIYRVQLEAMEDSIIGSLSEHDVSFTYQNPMPIPKKPFLFKAFFRRTADVGAINLKEAVPAWWHVLDMACKLMCQQQEPYTTWDDVMDWIWKMDATDRCVRCEVGSVKVLATVQKNHVAPACAVFWTFQKSCFDLKPSRREILHGI